MRESSVRAHTSKQIHSHFPFYGETERERTKKRPIHRIYNQASELRDNQCARKPNWIFKSVFIQWVLIISFGCCCFLLVCLCQSQCEISFWSKLLFSALSDCTLLIDSTHLWPHSHHIPIQYFANIDDDSEYFFNDVVAVVLYSFLSYSCFGMFTYIYSYTHILTLYHCIWSYYRNAYTMTHAIQSTPFNRFLSKTLQLKLQS